MQDSPKNGINWKFFFLSGVLLIPLTYLTVYCISPSHIPQNDAGPHGDRIDQLILYVHVLMGALFVGWVGYFFYVLLRFNKSNNPKADYEGVKSHASTYIEGIVALVEAVLLIGFAIPIWANAVDKFPTAVDNPTVIKVIAQQFQWNGWYPGPHGIFCSNDVKFFSSDNTFGLDKTDPHYKENFIVAKDLIVPVNKPVLAYISSLDVIHCFACKPLRVTQDAIPGMVFPAHFTPQKVAEYQIQCAQLCGVSHYGMRGTIKVVSQADYDKWVASKSSAGAAQAAATNKRIQAIVWGMLAATVVAIALAFFVFRPKAAPLPIYGVMPDFVLQNQDGRSVTLSDLHGKIWLADVIFTRCASQCPLMSAHLQAITRKIPADAPVRFVTLTTDAAFDTPPVMKKYAERYDADTSRWWFLTGDKSALRNFISDGLKLTSMDKAAVLQESPVDLFIHSAKFVLIDGQGRVRGYYDGEQETAVAQVTAAAEQLVHEP